MAFNWKTFRIRTATAIVFVVVMSFGLLWNRWSFLALFSLIHFGCWFEYQKLVATFNADYKKITPFHKYGIMIAGWCLMLFFTNEELVLGRVRLTHVGLYLGLASMVLLPVGIFIQSKNLYLKNILFSLVGIMYISLSLGLLIDMRNRWIEEDLDLNKTIPLLIIFTIWVNDTMAYIVGSLIGKTPLSSISPKKTWEGTIGGAILAIVVMCLIAYLTGRLSIVNTAVIAAIATIAGTFGDLFESKLKRMANVKDSGQLMPGHGGFLDRFDSLLFACTCCWFYVVIAL